MERNEGSEAVSGSWYHATKKLLLACNYFNWHRKKYMNTKRTKSKIDTMWGGRRTSGRSSNSHPYSLEGL